MSMAVTVATNDTFSKGLLNHKNLLKMNTSCYNKVCLDKKRVLKSLQMTF